MGIAQTIFYCHENQSHIPFLKQSLSVQASESGSEANLKNWENVTPHDDDACPLCPQMYGSTLKVNKIHVRILKKG